MITYLKDIENKALQDSKTANTAGSTSESDKPTTVNNPAVDLPGLSELGENHKAETVDLDFDMDSDVTCSCQDGWLSPRLKFILSTTAEVATDLIRDTGQLAGEFGHVGGVYFANFIPSDQIPRGKKASPLWVEGFSALFKVIHEMFEAGEIPTESALEHKLSRLPANKQKLIKAYGKQGAGVESVLEALIYGAKEEWEENEFEDVHGGEEWDKLPVCTEHDLNWTFAEDMLIG